MWKLLLLPACAVAFFLAAYFFFYQGGYTPPDAPDIAFAELTTIPARPVDFTDQPVFSGNPIGATARGILLVDTAHRNAFTRQEIVTLLSRVSDRGYAVEFMDDAGPTQMEAKLRQADAFMVISPLESYQRDEADLVVDFVAQGGKLLLIADPGRPNQLNGLSERVGISFQPDYLYNLAEYDTNFREFFVRDFQADAITSGIGELAFYYAGSIESAGPGLALTDGNTHSSIAERVVPRSPLSIGAHRNVLAVHDLTFMIPPYNSVRDNDRLVANIADFLTESERQYRLTDFPRFFDGPVDILLGQPDLFDQGTRLKQALGAQGVASDLQGVENGSRDLVFLGLYEDSAGVARYLDSAGVRIGDTLTAPFTPGITLEGTSVILLDRSGDRDVLLILADTPDGLGETVNQLETGKFRNGLADDFAGVYKY